MSADEIRDALRDIPNRASAQQVSQTLSEAYVDGNEKFYGWVAPYQDENTNREGGAIEEFVYVLNENNEINVDNLPIFDKLFKSQGYDVQDILDENKKGTFLDSFRAELNNASGLGVFVFTGTWTLNQIISIAQGGSLAVPKNVTCGIFNPVTGGGSLLGVKLEKDWEIPSTDLFGDYFFPFNINEEKMGNWGCSIPFVYGSKLGQDTTFTVH